MFESLQRPALEGRYRWWLNELWLRRDILGSNCLGTVLPGFLAGFTGWSDWLLKADLMYDIGNAGQRNQMKCCLGRPFGNGNNIIVISIGGVRIETTTAMTAGAVEAAIRKWWYQEQESSFSINEHVVATCFKPAQNLRFPYWIEVYMFSPLSGLS